MDIIYERLINTITLIKGGDYSLREGLIEDYRPFIWKTATQFCHRALEWGRDEELSVALIAFDSAIDSFQPDRGIPFLAFCRIVIVNRLKDLVRREGKYPSESRLDDELVAYYLEGKTAWQSYVNRTIDDERREEIQAYEALLGEYSIDFEDLVEGSPRHKDYRQLLINVARQLTESTELMELFLHRKKLPLQQLEQITGVKRKTLERGRKFIIASALLLREGERFVYLRSYIKL